METGIGGNAGRNDGAVGCVAPRKPGRPDAGVALAVVLLAVVLAGALLAAVRAGPADLSNGAGADTGVVPAASSWPTWLARGN